VFRYFDPLKDLLPTHTPEKYKHPEKWLYYDTNLDAVREEVGKDITFARNMDKD